MTKKAYIGIKFYEDNRNQNEIQAISKRLNQANYATICIARDIGKWGTNRLMFWFSVKWTRATKFRNVSRILRHQN